MTSLLTHIPPDSAPAAQPIAGLDRDRPRVLIPIPVLYASAACALISLWAAAIWIACHLHTDPLLHRAALFAHLAFLIVGFGAVLTLDWFGVLWLFGRRSLDEVVRMAAGAHLMIWLGLAGLTTSGILLNPHLHQLTWMKLTAVLVVALNGINAHHLQGILEAHTGPVGRGLLIRAGLTGAISQAGWWTACAIGFVNHG